MVGQLLIDVCCGVDEVFNGTGFCWIRRVLDDAIAVARWGSGCATDGLGVLLRMNCSDCTEYWIAIGTRELVWALTLSRDCANTHTQG